MGMQTKNEYWISLTDEELQIQFEETNDLSVINRLVIITFLVLSFSAFFAIIFIVYYPILVISVLLSSLLLIFLLWIGYSFYIRKKTEIIINKTTKTCKYQKISPEKLLFEIDFSEIRNLTYSFFELSSVIPTYSLLLEIKNRKKITLFLGNKKDYETIGLLISSFIDLPLTFTRSFKTSLIQINFIGGINLMLSIWGIFMSLTRIGRVFPHIIYLFYFLPLFGVWVFFLIGSNIIIYQEFINYQEEMKN